MADRGLMAELKRRDLAVVDLRLDPYNPRLPERLQGAGQVDLLDYLSQEAVLDELIRSLNDNGFFSHEPLIAYEDKKWGWVVLEGNRRLAALKVITGADEALDLDLKPATLEKPPTREQLKRLSEVPVYVVQDRDEVHRYLGFRHIGGIKKWSAESKARYLLEEVDKAAGKGSTKPFLEVARRVGSNSLGVRNSYTAIAVLRHARDEFGMDVTYVLHKRFGVWLRCMTASDVREYIGLNGGRAYEEVRKDIASVRRKQLAEVLNDLTARGGARPLVGDSRDVTVYGQVLTHKMAHAVLRRHEDLDVARQIVEQAELPERIRTLREHVDVVREEAQDAESSEALVNAAEDLVRAARALLGVVRALSEDDEVD